MHISGCFGEGEEPRRHVVSFQVWARDRGSGSISGVGDMKSTPEINCARFKNAREVPPRGI